MLIIGATAFAQFVLPDLYLQEALYYTVVETGVAFIAIAVTIIVFSNVGQALTTRLGARPVLSAGLVLTAAGGALYARMPADGHYFWNVFPALIVSGVGLAFSFVPVMIAGLTGVRPADAGVASGLINTSRQVHGSIGFAALTTITATATATTPTAGRCPRSAAPRSRTAFRSRSTCSPTLHSSEQRSPPRSSSRFPCGRGRSSYRRSVPTLWRTTMHARIDNPAVTVPGALEALQKISRDEAARHYDDAQLAALVLAIAAINAWNRLNVTTRQIGGEWIGRWVTPGKPAGQAARPVGDRPVGER